MFVLTTVGYMMDTMYFSSLDHPIDVDPDVGTVDTNTRDCSMNYTAGKPRANFHSFYLIDLQFFMVLHRVGFTYLGRMCTVLVGPPHSFHRKN